MFLSIGKAAQRLGVTVGIVRRRERTGRLRAAFRTSGNHRRFAVDDVMHLVCQLSAASVDSSLTLCYARISCHYQKDGLERQAVRLQAWCEGRAPSRVEVIRDLGSGLNYSKNGLMRLLDRVCRGKEPGW
jgi:putative resolvase